ncbi:MAG: DoxX family protein [Nitrospinota bacterium]
MLNRLLSRAAPWALLPVRIVVGITFLIAGGRKLFVFGFDRVGTSFASRGIPGAEFWAVVVPLVEFLGGIAILLGILTRYAAAALSIDMIVAILVVHLPAGYFLPRGYAYPMVVLGGCLALLLAGPGRGSLDSAIGLEDTS